MLTICLPEDCRREREYAADLVFREMLGLDVELQFQPRGDVVVRGPDGKEVVLSDQFFPHRSSRRWTPASFAAPRYPFCLAIRRRADSSNATDPIDLH